MNQKILSLEREKHSSNNSNEDLNKVSKENNELKKKIEELNKEIDELKKENECLKNSISLIFTSKDQNVHYSIICNKSDIFKTVEEKLYKQYPDYKLTESENSFFVRNNEIDKIKTLEENNIKDNDIIFLDK